MTPQDALRIMQSLSLLLQDSLETGNLDPSVYVDVAELMGYIATIAREKISK